MLCESSDETFNQLLMHTEVRKLSGGVSVQRLVDLHDSTVGLLSDADPSLCGELKNYKNYLFYFADPYWKFYEVQKRLQGKNVIIIQARMILLGFQVKLWIFKSLLVRRDFQYVVNLQQLLDDENISHDGLEICIKHLEKSWEDLECVIRMWRNCTYPNRFWRHLMRMQIMQTLHLL